MRVISGNARGIKLSAIEGLETRPTIDRVKEAVFSSIQFNLPAAKVLDLFCGTGQMGIEALSRGASLGVFIDTSKQAIETTTHNLKATNMFDKARVVNMSAQDFIRTTKDKFDIIFLDPPYNMGILEEILPKVCDILQEDGIIIVESELSWQIPDNLPNVKIKKQQKYGKILISRLIKE